MRHSEKRKEESKGESASAAGPGKCRGPASPHCRADGGCGRSTEV